MEAKYISRPCVICKVETIWACVDCAIDSGGKQSVHVCQKPECRDKHETLFHDKMRLEENPKQ